MLSSTGLGDEGFKALSEACKLNATLLNLDLFNNNWVITHHDEGGRAQAGVLKVNTKQQRCPFLPGWFAHWLLLLAGARYWAAPKKDHLRLLNQTALARIADTRPLRLILNNNVAETLT